MIDWKNQTRSVYQFKSSIEKKLQKSLDNSWILALKDGLHHFSVFMRIYV